MSAPILAIPLGNEGFVIYSDASGQSVRPDLVKQVDASETGPHTYAEAVEQAIWQEM